MNEHYRRAIFSQQDSYDQEALQSVMAAHFDVHKSGAHENA